MLLEGRTRHRCRNFGQSYVKKVTLRPGDGAAGQDPAVYHLASSQRLALGRCGWAPRPSHKLAPQGAARRRFGGKKQQHFVSSPTSISAGALMGAGVAGRGVVRIQLPIGGVQRLVFAVRLIFVPKLRLGGQVGVDSADGGRQGLPGPLVLRVEHEAASVEEVAGELPQVVVVELLKVQAPQVVQVRSHLLWEVLAEHFDGRGALCVPDLLYRS